MRQQVFFFGQRSDAVNCHKLPFFFAFYLHHREKLSIVGVCIDLNQTECCIIDSVTKHSWIKLTREGVEKCQETLTHNKQHMQLTLTHYIIKKVKNETRREKKHVIVKHTKANNKTQSVSMFTYHKLL